MPLVIAAIDNSAAARPVLAAAVAFGQLLGAAVEAVHVAEEDGQTAQACADSLAIPMRRLAGDPVTAVVARAGTPRVVGVAIGARRRVKGHGMGHVAQAVVDAVDKPVLVVPPGAPPVQRFRTALVALEGTPAKARAIKSAVELAAGADLELIVLHVDDESSIPSFSDQLAHEADAYAAEFLARYAPGAPRARLELRVGSPAEEIIAASTSLAVDVIALGWPKSAEPGRGRVARGVLDHSHVPVLLVALASDAAA
jgi:nucleotide-binding universal stress UspA family protein